MQVHACAFGQASAALVERHSRGRTHDEVSEAMLGAEPLAGRASMTSRRDWPGIAALEPARARSGPARRDPAAVPGAAGRDGGGAVTTPAETAQATTAILESGAIMLGAALVFVTLFRRLRLGATLGYIVAGALIGPQLLGLIQDPEQLTSVTEIGIALLLFIVGLELQPQPAVAAAHGHFRARPARRSCCAAWRSARCSISRSASRPRRRWRSACRSACRRPRRCCRCCARTMSSTRRRASAPSRSCCSRTCRSCR